MKTEQTAVEWLEKELIKRFKRSQIHYTNSEWCFDMIKKLTEQAKEMEKEQMDKVSGDWWVEGASYMNDGKRKYETFEQYYNETFGK
jgi:hypothetical protein